MSIIPDRRATGIEPAQKQPKKGSKSRSPSDGKKERSPSAAELLTGIGLSFDLWHDSTQTGYATAGRVSYQVRSKAYRNLLVHEYRKRTDGRVPNADALAAALNAIEGAAVHDGPEHPAHVRIAGREGRVYLHLADPDSTVIEVSADGWRACER